MDWFMGSIITVAVVVVILFSIAIPIAIHNDNQFVAACHTKGGKVIRTKSQFFCMKPDAFIDVNAN